MGAENGGPILAWPTSSPANLLPRSSPPKSLQGIILLNVPGIQPMTLGVPERATHSLWVEMAKIKAKVRPDLSVLPPPAPSGHSL